MGPPAILAATVQETASAGPAKRAPIASGAGLAIVAAVALLAVIEAATALIAPRRVASDADWEAAAAEVRASFKKGDLIVFAPEWSDEVGRLHLGDLVTPEMAARADASRYARIWEVAIRGAHAPETTAPSVYPKSSTAHGRVKVTLYERDDVIHPLYDFTAHADAARVTELAAGSEDERPCPRDHDAAFRCPTTRVERRIMEIDFAPRLGLLAPAGDRGQVTRIDYAEVPLGNSIVGYTGMHDWHSRKNGVGAVDFKLFIDGSQILAERHDNNDGWHRFVVPTLHFAGTTHAVRFEISSPAGSRERNFGFHAESRSEPPPSGIQK